jgi:hypothetical protein
MYAILHLVSATYVHISEEGQYQCPKIAVFPNKYEADRYVREHTFRFKLRGQFYGIMDTPSYNKDTISSSLKRFIGYIPNYELETVEFPSK